MTLNKKIIKTNPFEIENSSKSIIKSYLVNKLQAIFIQNIKDKRMLYEIVKIIDLFAFTLDTITKYLMN